MSEFTCENCGRRLNISSLAYVSDNAPNLCEDCLEGLLAQGELVKCECCDEYSSKSDITYKRASRGFEVAYCKCCLNPETGKKLCFCEEGM